MNKLIKRKALLIQAKAVIDEAEALRNLANKILDQAEFLTVEITSEQQNREYDESIDDFNKEVDKIRPQAE